MAATRLSKLQKWILRNSYQERNGQVIKVMKKEDVFRYFKNTYFIGNQELVINNNFKAFMTPQEYNKAHATISRSLRGLRDKGYVKLIGKKQIEQPDYDRAMEFASKYKTQSEFEAAMKDKSIEEMIKMTNSLTGKKVDVAFEIKGHDKTNVRFIELTDLGIEKAKGFLKLSS